MATNEWRIAQAFGTPPTEATEDVAAFMRHYAVTPRSPVRVWVAVVLVLVTVGLGIWLIC